MKLAKYSTCEWALLKRFSSLEVKCQGRGEVNKILRVMRYMSGSDRRRSE